MNSIRRPWLLTGILLALISTPLFAQDDTTDPGAPAEESQTDSAATDAEGDDTETDTSEADRAATRPLSWNRLIYIPFRELQKVFGNDDATAVVPYDEYMRLLKHYLQESAPDSSPEAVITKAVYSAAIEEDVVRISAELRITILKDSGWARLPLSFGQSAVGRMSSDDDANTILQGIDKGQYELLLQGAGQRTVTIELLAPISTTPEARTFETGCPATGISELQVTIPDGDQTVSISPTEVLLPADGSNESQTVVKAALGSTKQFSVRWFPRAGSRPQMDLLASVSSETRIDIEPQLLQTTTKFTWEVLRGEMQEATVLVPADARIIDVVATAGRIQSWETAEQNGHQQIRIQLLTPVTDKLEITIQTERVPQSDTLQLLGRTDSGVLHGNHADGVVRESGRITVAADSSLTLITQQQSGVKRISAPQTDSQSGLQWEFSGIRSSLVVQTRPVEPRLTTVQNSQLVFSDDELLLLSQIVYTVERAGVFELQLKYPESLTIDSVRADGMSEFNVDREGGIITLALTNRRQGKIGVHVRAHQAFDASADGVETVLPSIAPQHTERSTGQVTVLAPQFLDVITIEERLSGLAPSGSPAGAVGRAQPVSAWTYTQHPWTLAVRTSPRPAQVDAVVATTAQIDPEVVRFNSEIRFNIRNAGIDTFRLAAPEEFADDIRFRSLIAQHVIQQRDRTPAAEDGWVTWKLTLRSEVTGTVRIAADWEQPLEDASEQQIRSIEARPLQVLPPYPEGADGKRRVTLTQTRGELRLLRHESLSITADGSGDTTEAIDVRELQQLPQEGFLAFRYFAQPASATISIREHEIHEVVATVVSKAAVEIVTEKQALAGYRCRYQITSSERQRLRIDVPVDSELQAPSINGRRTTFEPAGDVDSEEGWEPYYINISRKGTSDDRFLLSFQLRCPIVEAGRFPYEGQGGEQILRLPKIGDSSGNTVVQETRVGLWTPGNVNTFGEPEHWSAIGSSHWSVLRPFRPSTDRHAARAISDWIDDKTASGEFAHQGNAIVFQALGNETVLQVSWWHRPFTVAVISGALILIGLVLRNTSWENRITMIILAVVAMSMGAMFDSGAAFQITTAASPGLLAIAGIWITSLLIGRSTGQDGSDPDDSGPSDDSDDSDDSGDDGDSDNDDDSRGSDDSPPNNTEPGVRIIEDNSSTPPPGTVSPAPEIQDTMNELMGGK